jgi:transposase
MSNSVGLSPEQRQKIQEWNAAHGTPQQVALRCRIVLGAAEGEADSAIARRLSVNRNTVILWRKRFLESGLDGLWDIASGRGRKPIYDMDKVTAIVEATLQTKPAGMTHWSCRTLAEQQGVSKSTVNNIWRAHNLQPHRTETFKLSRDPKFLEKMTDVVGLYLNPPQQAIVLCVDEKSQIQALDRTQPGLPIKKGRCGTMTHDYKRNGTTTLFAALETLQGKVAGECYHRHRHQEFLKFLRRLDKEFPGKVPLHLIMDNYGTHKHERVKACSSWMNLVERWFGHLDNKAIKRGVFLSVADLQASIAAFLNTWNASPQPFVWTATVESIQQKLSRCRQTLEQIQPGCTSPKTRKRKKVPV